MITLHLDGDEIPDSRISQAALNENRNTTSQFGNGGCFGNGPSDFLGI